MNADVPNNTTKKQSLNLSISSQQQQRQILKPTKCPTKTCKECKLHYIDKLGLDIFVICNCKCHRLKADENNVLKLQNIS